jgi:hypothetical protein
VIYRLVPAALLAVLAFAAASVARAETDPPCAVQRVMTNDQRAVVGTGRLCVGRDGTVTMRAKLALPAQPFTVYFMSFAAKPPAPGGKAVTHRVHLAHGGTHVLRDAAHLRPDGAVYHEAIVVVPGDGCGRTVTGDCPSWAHSVLAPGVSRAP